MAHRCYGYSGGHRQAAGFESSTLKAEASAVDVGVWIVGMVFPNEGLPEITGGADNRKK
jgi:hypothetical protein